MCIREASADARPALMHLYLMPSPMVSERTKYQNQYIPFDKLFCSQSYRQFGDKTLNNVQFRNKFSNNYTYCSFIHKNFSTNLLFALVSGAGVRRHYCEI